LGWLQDEEDKSAACEQVLIDADAGNATIITSALTIAEVLAVKGKKPIPKDRRNLVTAFFKRDYIEVLSITRRMAEAARELVWDAGIDPKDALHVATAISADLTEIHTFDVKLTESVNKFSSGKITASRPYVAQGNLPQL
jgi:predicted nucleic acid-binding protein